MPHIRFKAVSMDVVKELSKVLPKDLAQIINTTEDNFSFELVNSQFFENGTVTAFYPFIEFAWFDRGQAVQDEVAKLLTREIKKRMAVEYVAVVFYDLPKSSYYENGEHFG